MEAELPFGYPRKRLSFFEPLLKELEKHKSKHILWDQPKDKFLYFIYIIDYIDSWHLIYLFLGSFKCSHIINSHFLLELCI